MKIAENITDLVGNTPLMEFKNIEKERSLTGEAVWVIFLDTL